MDCRFSLDFWINVPYMFYAFSNLRFGGVRLRLETDRDYDERLRARFPRGGRIRAGFAATVPASTAGSITCDGNVADA
jgi:hypothetical protein